MGENLCHAVIDGPDGFEAVSVTTRAEGIALRKAHAHFWCTREAGGCGGELSVVAGALRAAHFRHHLDAVCAFGSGGTASGGAYAHLAYQRALAQWVADQGYVARIEHTFEDAGGRADLHVTIDGVDQSIEVQLTSISDEEWRERDARYSRHVSVVTWLHGPASERLREVDRLEGDFSLTIETHEGRVRVGTYREGAPSWADLGECKIGSGGIWTPHVAAARLAGDAARAAALEAARVAALEAEEAAVIACRQAEEREAARAAAAEAALEAARIAEVEAVRVAALNAALNAAREAARAAEVEAARVAALEAARVAEVETARRAIEDARRAESEAGWRRRAAERAAREPERADDRVVMPIPPVGERSVAVLCRVHPEMAAWAVGQDWRWLIPFGPELRVVGQYMAYTVERLYWRAFVKDLRNPDVSAQDTAALVAAMISAGVLVLDVGNVDGRWTRQDQPDRVTA
ncbi:MAG: competence protein CoiA family protein [Cellulomonas sp.]